MKDGIIIKRLEEYTCCYYHGNHVVFYNPSEHVLWLNGRLYWGVYLSPNYMIHVVPENTDAVFYLVKEIDFKHGTLGKKEELYRLNLLEEGLESDFTFGIHGIFIRRPPYMDIYVSPAGVKEVEHYGHFVKPRYIGHEHIIEETLYPRFSFSDNERTCHLEVGLRVGDSIYQYRHLADGTVSITCQGETVCRARDIKHITYIDGKLLGFIAEKNLREYLVILDGKKKREKPLEMDEDIIPCLELRFL